MSKLIIKNNSSHADVVALYFVSNVINMGRVSGESYCLVATFDEEAIRVFASRTKSGTDVFRVEDI